MFNSSFQSGSPTSPHASFLQSAFLGNPPSTRAVSRLLPELGAAAKLPFPAHFSLRYLKVICGSAPRNLLGRSEAGCKPRFSDLRWFKRPQFVELLHEYLMIIFLGCLEAKK